MGKERGEGRGGERAPCVCVVIYLSTHNEGAAQKSGELVCVLLTHSGCSSREGKGRAGTGVGVGGAEGNVGGIHT